MNTLPRAQADIAWDLLWTAMSSEWFKLEVLQDYSGEDTGESLRAWMQGDKERSLELLQSGPHTWADECSKKVSRGARLIRIHVVDYPLSEYVQWEVEAYKHRNIPLGKEEVYLLDRKDVSDLELPAGDMMIFDQQNVIIGNYDESGYAATQTFYNLDDDISRFLDLREKLLKAKLVRV